MEGSKNSSSSDSESFADQLSCLSSEMSSTDREREKVGKDVHGNC